MGDLIESTKGAPWYVLLSVALFMIGVLIFKAKSWFSNDAVERGDNGATLRSIDIYEKLLTAQRLETDKERAARVAAEDKYDAILLKYAELSGQVSALTQKVEIQTSMIIEQAKTIDSLRTELAQFKREVTK